MNNIQICLTVGQIHQPSSFTKERCGQNQYSKQRPGWVNGQIICYRCLGLKPFYV